MIIGKGSSAPMRKPTLSFERKTAFRVYKTNSQNFAFASPASPVEFNQISYDAGSNWSQSGFRYRVPLTGIYQLNCTVTIRQEADGSPNIFQWLMSETGVIDTPIAAGWQGFFRGGLNGDIHGLNMAASVVLQKDQEIYMQVSISNGGIPMTVQGAGTDYWCWFSGFRLESESRTRLQ